MATPTTRTHATALIMHASALALGALGLALLFAPQEGARAFGWGDGGILAPSIAASGFLALAILDWMGRNAIYGGIYGRPIIMGNLMFSLTSGLPLWGAQLNGPDATPLGWLPVLILTAHGTAFALMLFGRIGGAPDTELKTQAKGTE